MTLDQKKLLLAFYRKSVKNNQDDDQCILPETLGMAPDEFQAAYQYLLAECLIWKYDEWAVKINCCHQQVYKMKTENTFLSGFGAELAEQIMDREDRFICHNQRIKPSL